MHCVKNRYTFPVCFQRITPQICAAVFTVFVQRIETNIELLKLSLVVIVVLCYALAGFKCGIAGRHTLAPPFYYGVSTIYFNAFLAESDRARRSDFVLDKQYPSHN